MKNRMGNIKNGRNSHVDPPPATGGSDPLLTNEWRSNDEFLPAKG
jgi:hypothetical protein